MCCGGRGVFCMMQTLIKNVLRKVENHPTYYIEFPIY